MARPTVREAALADAPAITEIYNHYIRTSTATFDTVPKSVDDRVAWLQSRSNRHPVFVAEKGGEVVGWASLSSYRDRPAWSFTVEAGMYVRADRRGEGIGTLLLESLVDAATSLGHHVVLAQIVSENEHSLQVVERAGFRHVGTLREVGRKFDRWLDVSLMQHIINPEEQ